MIKILQVYPVMNNAGTEMVIMNLFQNIDASKVHFDFLVQDNGERDNEIIQAGSTIYKIPFKNKKQYYHDLIEFFHEHPEYAGVHTHTHGQMGVVLKAAKKCDIKLRIAHSHNARQDLPKIARLYKYLTSHDIEDNATDFFACSKEAAKWLFPRRYRDFMFLPNGIEIDKFIYNQENRNEIRKEFGIGEHDFVVGHIGRLAKQKNHDFIIDIVDNLKKHKNIKFLCIGEGPLFDDLLNRVNELGLQDKIILAGSRNDAYKFYSAFDLFILPSLHEGLGIVAIEAQTAGLQTIVSDGVPKAADCGLGLFKMLGIKKEDVKKWSEAILNQLESYNSLSRSKFYNQIKESDYNIKFSAKKIEKFYLSKVED